MNQKTLNYVPKEIKLLHFFNHSNIVKIYQTFESEHNIYAVMEYVDGGELFDLLTKKKYLSEPEAFQYFIQVLAAVEYCHSNLITHRDLKLENILIDKSGLVKIADFGLSNFLKDGKFLKTPCGSPNYAAPEILSGKCYCGSEVDIWSLGVILYALLTGNLPFVDNSMPNLFQKIKEGKFIIPQNLSGYAQDLLKEMLQVNSLARIKINRIKEHPWILKHLNERQINLLSYINEINNIFQKKEIDELIFNTIISDPNFDFLNFTPQAIREKIIQNKNNDFVIGYNLIFDEQKKSLMPNFSSELEIENFKRYHPFSSINQVMDYKMQTAKEITFSFKTLYSTQNFDSILKNDIKNENGIAFHAQNEWRYGQIFYLPSYVLFYKAINTLAALDTTFFINRNKKRLKCIKKIKKSHANNYESMEYLHESSGHEELSFHVFIFIKHNIYMKKPLYAINLQKIKGNTMFFLEYANWFYTIINLIDYEDHSAREKSQNDIMFLPHSE